MYYACVHGKKVQPTQHGLQRIEPCAECPTTKEHVKYGPVYAEGEVTVEQRLKAARNAVIHKWCSFHESDGCPCAT